MLGGLTHLQNTFAGKLTGRLDWALAAECLVWQEAKAKNTSAYQRLRALTSAKDRRFFVFSNENHK